MNNWDELKNQGLTSKTEVKFENSIKRTTAVANPRQIERVVRGAEFPIDIVYELADEGQIAEDFETLKNGFQLLQYDYLGGSGSRGYGKVIFKDFQVDVVIGELDDKVLEHCQEIMSQL